MSGFNQKIIDKFKRLIKQLKQDIETKTRKQEQKDLIAATFRLAAIRKALDIIKKIPFEITSIPELKKYVIEHQLKLSDRMMNKIQEILTTGTLEELRKETEELPPEEEEEESELEGVFGIGTKTAKELKSQYNIHTFDDLVKYYNEHTEEELQYSPIFGNENIVKGIKYYKKINNPIKHEDIDEILIILLRAAMTVSPNLHLIICGSYRRQKPTSNDIDVLLTSNKFKTKNDTIKSPLLQKFIQRLMDINFIVDSFTQTDVKTKYMGICKFKDNLIRIDIRFIPYESYYFAILYFTGSKDFNRKMRLRAIRRNFKLNEYGLISNETKNKYIVSSEKEIFDILRMQYINPTQR